MSSVCAVWSTKGGVGVSTVAAMLAIAQVERADETLIVDLCGDIPAVLGLPEPTGPGLSDWTQLANPSTEALARIEIEVQPGLRLLPVGTLELSGDVDPLVRALGASSRAVIIDCGQLSLSPFRQHVAAASTTSLLVVRSCFLTLQSARNRSVSPTGVVLLHEAGRALGLSDVESVVQTPVVVRIGVDQSLARSIDAGLLSRRLPRRLLRALGQVLSDGQ